MVYHLIKVACLIVKCNLFKLIITRRSTVLSLPVQYGFLGWIKSSFSAFDKLSRRQNYRAPLLLTW